MTIFPEWNSDWWVSRETVFRRDASTEAFLSRLIPYYHYVPIQIDYSDLYDTLAFFSGTPDGIPGHDKLAEKIGSHGHEFTANHWRVEDMQVYVSTRALRLTLGLSSFLSR
jgi:hypothetical protein